MAIPGNLIAIYTLGKSGIRRPKDLEGKSIGDSPGGGIILYPAFAKLHGIKKWNFVRMTPAAKNPSLLAGKIDFIDPHDGLSRASAAGEETGVKVNEMLWSENGIDVYS